MLTMMLDQIQNHMHTPFTCCKQVACHVWAPHRRPGAQPEQASERVHATMFCLIKCMPWRAACWGGLTYGPPKRCLRCVGL